VDHIDSSTIKANVNKDKVITKLKLLSENLFNVLDKDMDYESENSHKISRIDPDTGYGKEKNLSSIFGYKACSLRI
jgi:hypothetical protein